MQNYEYSKLRIVIVEMRGAPELLGFDILCEEEGVWNMLEEAFVTVQQRLFVMGFFSS